MTNDLRDALSLCPAIDINYFTFSESTRDVLCVNADNFVDVGYDDLPLRIKWWWWFANAGNSRRIIFTVFALK
jgi:hypothetical protein